MESLAIDIVNTPRRPLDAAHVARIREAGEEVRFSAGETIIPLGAPMDAFY